MTDRIDRYSFILGMITAFSECVAAGCKRMALSPPLYAGDHGAVAKAAAEIIEKHGLIHYHELNEDLPESQRFEWIVIAARQDTIDRYLALRASGLSPAVSLSPFAALLSYSPADSVHTGYDAFRALFPPEERREVGPRS